MYYPVLASFCIQPQMGNNDSKLYLILLLKLFNSKGGVRIKQLWPKQNVTQFNILNDVFFLELFYVFIYALRQNDSIYK